MPLSFSFLFLSPFFPSEPSAAAHNPNKDRVDLEGVLLPDEAVDPDAETVVAKSKKRGRSVASLTARSDLR